MVYRRKPADLSDKRPLLDALGRCRRTVIDAQDRVVPFGTTYKALSVVTVAIDSVAEYLTGDSTFYHAGGSAPGSSRDKWVDSEKVG